MTNIEQEFFKTFGIEKQKEYGCTDTWDECHHKREYPNCKGCPFWELIGTEYPSITDRILLELICIITKSNALFPIFISRNIEDLKEEIMQTVIKIETKFKHNSKIDVKHQVRSLFEGVE